MSSFLDIRFPKNISYGSSGGPGYNTSVIEVRSGAEKRNANWDYPRCEYDVSYGVRKQFDLEALIEMFHIAKGRAHSFRYWDPLDYKSCRTDQAPTFTDQVIGTGDGSTDEFQIYKTYSKTGLDGSTVYSRTRKISKIATGSILVGIGGVEQIGNWVVDEATGMITFTTNSWSIVSIDETSDWVKVSGDKTGDIADGDSIEITGSTDNDGVFTVSGTSYDSGSDETQITVTGDIVGSVADGSVKHGQPNDGVSVTAGYEFDVHARFDTDRISASIDDYQQGTIDVPVIEVK